MGAPDWWVLLEGAIYGGSSSARLANLATVDAAGHPRTRVVALRSLEGAQIVFTSDARSEKVAHLAADDRAELCLWLSGEQMQLRIAGRVRVSEDPELREARWRKLSAPLRSSFSDPAPKQARDPQEAAQTQPAEQIPSAFCVLALQPEEVDVVDLREPALRRYLYHISDQGWLGREVWP